MAVGERFKDGQYTALYQLGQVGVMCGLGRAGERQTHMWRAVPRAARGMVWVRALCRPALPRGGFSPAACPSSALLRWPPKRCTVQPTYHHYHPTN